MYYITVRALIWSSFSFAVNYLFPKINDKTTLKYFLFPVQSGVHVSKKAQLIASLFYLQHARCVFVVKALDWHSAVQCFTSSIWGYLLCFKSSLPSTIRCHSLRKKFHPPWRHFSLKIKALRIISIQLRKTSARCLLERFGGSFFECVQAV